MPSSPPADGLPGTAPEAGDAPAGLPGTAPEAGHAPAGLPDDAPGAGHGQTAARRRVARQVLFWARMSFVLVGSLPWWLPVARRTLPGAPLWLLLDWLFLPVCHRLPSRTLMITGVAMPLCSRCAGIFAGLALGALVERPRLGLRAARWALATAGLLMLLDVLAQELGWHPLWHSTRIATGVLLGHLMACTLFAAIRRERPPAPAR
jgi:uncharacterized membrane protein